MCIRDSYYTACLQYKIFDLPIDVLFWLRTKTVTMPENGTKKHRSASTGFSNVIAHDKTLLSVQK